MSEIYSHVVRLIHKTSLIKIKIKSKFMYYVQYAHKKWQNIKVKGTIRNNLIFLMLISLKNSERRAQKQSVKRLIKICVQNWSLIPSTRMVY